MPVADAAMRSTCATATTAMMTTKSMRVPGRSARRKTLRSNIFHATTSRMPASAPMGTQAMRPPSTRNASRTKTPSAMPDSELRPPLVTFINVAPMVPAPAMPPTKNDAMLAVPCPMSSRLELCRRCTSVSSTTPVLRVSMDNSTASVSAETKTRVMSAGPVCSSEVARDPTAPRNEPDVTMGPITSRLPASVSNVPSKNASAK